MTACPWGASRTLSVPGSVVRVQDDSGAVVGALIEVPAGGGCRFSGRVLGDGEEASARRSSLTFRHRRWTFFAGARPNVNVGPGDSVDLVRQGRGARGHFIRDAGTPGCRGHEDVDAAAGRPVSVVRGSPVPDLIRRRGGAPADRAGKAHGEGHRSGDAACSSGALSARGLRPRRSLPTLTSGRWPPGARPRGTVPTHRLRTRRPARACPRRPPCRHRLPRRARGR